MDTHMNTLKEKFTNCENSSDSKHRLHMTQQFLLSTLQRKRVCTPPYNTAKAPTGMNNLCPSTGCSGPCTQGNILKTKKALTQATTWMFGESQPQRPICEPMYVKHLGQDNVSMETDGSAALRALGRGKGSRYRLTGWNWMWSRGPQSLGKEDCLKFKAGLGYIVRPSPKKVKLKKKKTTK